MLVETTERAMAHCGTREVRSRVHSLPTRALHPQGAERQSCSSRSCPSPTHNAWRPLFRRSLLWAASAATSACTRCSPTWPRHHTRTPPKRRQCAPLRRATRADSDACVGGQDRGGLAYTTDERYCIDNGAMIAYTGARAPVPTRRNFR